MGVGLEWSYGSSVLNLLYPSNSFGFNRIIRVFAAANSMRRMKIVSVITSELSELSESILRAL